MGLHPGYPARIIESYAILYQPFGPGIGVADRTLRIVTVYGREYCLLAFRAWDPNRYCFPLSLIDMKGRKSDSNFDIDQCGSNRGCAVASELENP